MFFKGLYGLDKKGSFKVWAISVTEVSGCAYITVTHGKEGGEQQEKVTTIRAGKQGRSVYEQGVSEAEGKLKKQVDKGYREDKTALESLPLLAMLAGDYRKIGHRTDWDGGVDLSDKLDGVRCLAKCIYDDDRQESVITLESRTGQPYDLPHVVQELYQIMEVGDILDGEIYLHGHILQDITSAVKRTDTRGEIDKAARKAEKARYADPYDEAKHDEASAELEEAYKIHVLRPQLQFIVFDIPSEDFPWYDRNIKLRQYYMSRIRPASDCVQVLEYTRVFSEAEMKIEHKDAVARGYEGVMLRNREGLYESGKRSADLQKYKEFLDSEFLILDVIPDKDGNGVFELKNDVNGETFTAVMGSHSERAHQLLWRHELVGKWLTVKFQSRYKDTLLPQFPTGVCIRACNAQGVPVA